MHLYVYIWMVTNHWCTFGVSVSVSILALATLFQQFLWYRTLYPIITGFMYITKIILFILSSFTNKYIKCKYSNIFLASFNKFLQIIYILSNKCVSMISVSALKSALSRPIVYNCKLVFFQYFSTSGEVLQIISIQK